MYRLQRCLLSSLSSIRCWFRWHFRVDDRTAIDLGEILQKTARRKRTLLFIDAIHIDDDKRLLISSHVCVMFHRLSFLAGVFKLRPVGTRDGGRGPLFPTF